MLTWFRARASGVAVVVLASLASLASLGVSLVQPHALDCHDDCGTASVAHDASAHRIGAAGADADSYPLHCRVCHFARSFRPHSEVKFVNAPAAPAGVLVHFEIFTASPAARVAQPPLRSPPASPVLS